MGLDMYLRAKRYLSDYRPEDKAVKDAIEAIPGLKNASMPVMEVSCEAMYWRKSNQVHRWFVENVQDGVDNCGHYWVGRDKLWTLVDLCTQVLADRSLAKTLLPTQDGFFFGDTQYDEWYFGDLEHTVKGLEQVLKNVPDDHVWSFEYHSSW